MASDGISIQTTLSQMGNVARSQTKAQQAGENTAPVAEQINRDRDQKVERVKEPEKAEKGRVNPDEEKEKRQARSRGRGGGQGDPDAPEDGDDDEDGDPKDAADPGGLGLRIDTRA